MIARRCKLALSWILLLMAAPPTALAAPPAALAAGPAAPAATPRASVTITNPPGALLLGQPFTFTATCDPPGGTFTWRVIEGATKVTPTTGTGATFLINTIAASARREDVRVQVSCHGKEDRCALTVVELKLESVSYGGTGFRPVVQDSGSPYTAPQWNDGAVNAALGNRTFPLLYVRGATVAIAAVVCKVTPSDFTSNRDFTLRGTELQDLTIFTGPGRVANGKLTSSRRMDGSRALMNSAGFLDTYDIFWEASIDGANFVNVGVSNNRLYVSLASPAGVTLFETVVHLACANQQGAMTQAQAVAGIWPTFQSRVVHRKPFDGFGRRDYLRLSYYVPVQRSCLTYAQLCSSPIGNGQCGSWAQLLQATTRVHGMDRTVSKEVFVLSTKPVGTIDVPTVVIRNRKPVTINVPTVIYPDGFLVKEWRFVDTFVHTGGNGINNSTRLPDDNPIVPLNEGFPYTVGIRAKTGRTITTVPVWDDMLAGNTEIWTGPDGVCDTTANLATEDQLIQPRQGAPNKPCILPGANRRIDSTVRPDDMTSTGGGSSPLFPNEIGKTALNLIGIPGQHNPEPPESFNNHVICEILGELYDPSYGAGPIGGATRDNDYENAAIAGLKRGIYAKPNDRTKTELNYVRQ